MPTVPARVVSKDLHAEMMTLRIKDQSSSDGVVLPARYCTQIVLCSGVSASHAFGHVPMTKWGSGYLDRDFGEVALKRSGPVGDSLKLRRRGAAAFLDPVANVSVDKIVGTLVTISHNLSNDSALLELYDDRWLLSQLTMIGLLVYDTQSQRHYWDMGRECIYNEMGLPDCVDSPLGPCHAPCPKSGYSDTHYKEPEYGNATKQARTWTAADVINNMRLRFVSGNSKLPVYLGHRWLSPYILWAEGLGAGLAGMSQPLKSFRLQNMSLLEALQAVVRKGGAYDIYMSPIGSDFKSQLRILDMGPSGYTNLAMQTADFRDSSLEECLSNPLIVSEGYVAESVHNYYDEFIKAGDPPAIEQMLSQPDAETDNSDPLVLEGLEPAFLSDDKTALEYRESPYWKKFTARILELGDTREAAVVALSEFPLIGQAYRVALKCNPWEGSKWDGYVNGGRMRFLPQNATGYNSTAENPRDFVPFDIVVEAFFDFVKEVDPIPSPLPDLLNQWETVNCNISLSPDGTVLLAGTAERFVYYIARLPLDPAHPEIPNPLFGQESKNIRLRPIRANVTVQADWPITGVGIGDPNGDAERVDAENPTSYVSAAQQGDYVELLRGKYAHPFGWAGIRADDGTLLQPMAVDPHYTGGDELYSDEKLLNTHSQLQQKDVRKVEKNGLLRVLQLSPGMEPGLRIALYSKDGVKINGVVKTVTLSQVGHSLRNPNDRAPDTWFELGPADFATLLEMPSATLPSPGVRPAPYETPSTAITGSMFHVSDTAPQMPAAAPAATSGTSSGYQKPRATAAERLRASGDEGDAGAKGRSGNQYAGPPRPVDDWGATGNHPRESDGTTSNQRQDAIRDGTNLADPTAPIREKHWPGDGTGDGNTPSRIQRPGESAQMGRGPAPTVPRTVRDAALYPDINGQYPATGAGDLNPSGASRPSKTMQDAAAARAENWAAREKAWRKATRGK